MRPAYPQLTNRPVTKKASYQNSQEHIAYPAMYIPLSRWGYKTSGGTRKPVPLSEREAGSLSRLDRGGAESRETRENLDKG